MRVKIFSKELLQLLKRDWRYFLWTSLLLVIGVGIGQNLPKQNWFAELLTKTAFHKLAELKQWYVHAPLLGKIALIWSNNFFVSLMAIVSGIFILPPVLILIENGAIIGLFQKLVVLKTRIAIVGFYLSLVPHGIFELPAFIIACALGIRFGLIPWRLIANDIQNRTNRPLFREYFHDLRYYAVLIVVILLIAAIMEVTVSPLLLKAFGTKI